MAADALASATVVRGGEASDVSFPVGTTVAGLLAMLRIDTTTGAVAVSTPDGCPADPAWAIGEELPSGVLLAVTRPLAAQAVGEAAKRARDEWFWPATRAVSALMLAVAVDAAVVVAPVAFGVTVIPWWARVAAAFVAASFVVAAMSRPGVLRSGAGSVFLPGLVGLAAFAFVDPADPLSVSVGVVAAACLAFVTGLVASLWADSGALGAATAVWGAVAGAACAVVALQLGVQVAAPLAMAAGVVVSCVAPRYSVKVPETQLMDLSVVATSVAAARAPTMPPPAAITNARVVKTVADAQGRIAALSVAGASLVSVAAWPTAGRVGVSTLSEVGALVTMAAAAALLLFAPQTGGWLTHAASRASGAALVAVGVARAGVDGLVPWTAAGAALAAAGLCGALFVSVAGRRPESALLVRLADLVRGLAGVALLPAAVLGSGLFDLLWRVAS